jgi:3-hydroxyisobutyrate dehydrogenase
MDTFAMTHIAFIGLGAMGSGMAANLAKAGHQVKAYDLDATAVARAVAAGCVAAGDVEEAVTGAATILTMLPTGEHVRKVYEGADGVLAHAQQGALLLDCSTISVDDARAVQGAALGLGFEMCDAPVSGGVAAAQAGSLTFMVGGSDTGFARAQPILLNMGKAAIHAGASGAGQAAKICNNMLLAISMIGTCEAFALAEKLGLDARAFFEIAGQSSGQCWSMTSYAPVAGLVPSAPSNRDFTNGFAASLMLKDLRLARDAANSVEAVTPMGVRAEEIYSKYVSNYSPDRDFSGVIAMLSKEFMPL